MNRKVGMISAVVAASLVSGSLAFATTIASSKVTACADKSTGVLRVAASCKTSEKAVPLISGSVQLAPIYTDADKKPLNVVNVNFDNLGKPWILNALVSGKYVTVNAKTGKVYPVGSTTYNDRLNSRIYYLQNDCSDTPFIWYSNASGTDDEVREVYSSLTTQPNYAGYFVYTHDGTDQYFKIINTPTAFADGATVYRKIYDGTCSRDTYVNNSSGYGVSGFTTIALQTYTGTRLPDFRAPIKVSAQ